MLVVACALVAIEVVPADGLPGRVGGAAVLGEGEGVGEVLCIPRGAVHQFANSGDLDAKALAIATPGVIGPDFFREAGAILDAAAGGPPDLAALGAVMRKHGLTPAA